MLVPHVIRKAIILKVNSEYWSQTSKYDIRIPGSVREAKEIDAENGNMLWWDAICEEMKNVRIALKEFDGYGVPIGFKKINCHMIFNIKLGRKARLVAEEHKTEAPASSVVSRDSVVPRTRHALLVE